MKKIIAMILACLMVASLAACKSEVKDEDTTTSDAVVEVEKEEVKEEVIEEKEEVQSNYAHEHIRCPKCHKPFDGNICFYCGFTSVNKEKNEELESLWF